MKPKFAPWVPPTFADDGDDDDDCGDAGDGDVEVTLNANDKKPEVRARRVHWKF